MKCEVCDDGKSKISLIFSVYERSGKVGWYCVECGREVVK